MSPLLAALLCACLFLYGEGEAHGCTVASWYGGGERLAKHTANGEVFRPSGLTAAHRRYPFNTKLRVTFKGRSVVVRINDRGPHSRTGRSLDISRGAASALGIIHRGVACVGVTVVR